jgi:UPF0716 protein FxsA
MQESGPMSLVKWAFLTILLLPAAELAALLLIAALIGWLPAIALFLATSGVGIVLLRHSGRGDLDRVRRAFAQDGLRALHLETPGFAAVLGGILLVFPGFITDILGAALFLPAFRRAAAATLGRVASRRPTDTSVIDLKPDEWHQIPDRKPPRRHKSNGGA